MKTASPAVGVVGADGVRLRLADGREVLDGVGSWWTAVHGYNHPHIRERVRAQLGVLPHVMLGGLAHEQAYTLARRLAQLLPGTLDHVFFSESGSVAVEVAMKMAMQFRMNRGEPTRSRFIAFTGGYHGDTLGTMAVCDPVEGMHARFRDALVQQVICDLPATEPQFAEFEAVVAERAAELAGLLIEPRIQGAGGMRTHSVEQLRRIVDIARRHDLLVIFDEIFVGFGRTGQMFVAEEMTPDIVCLGKALTGGTLPLAATVASTHVFEAFYRDDDQSALMHGPTFMGNACACAAANASLDLFEREPRLEQVATIERWLTEALAPARSLPNVQDVRVLGAMGAIEMAEPPDARRLTAWFLDRGVFLRPFGRILYTTPPYVADEDAIRTIGAALVGAASS